jgi:hypothetical protein
MMKKGYTCHEKWGTAVLVNRPLFLSNRLPRESALSRTVVGDLC